MNHSRDSDKSSGPEDLGNRKQCRMSKDKSRRSHRGLFWLLIWIALMAVGVYQLVMQLNPLPLSAISVLTVVVLLEIADTCVLSDVASKVCRFVNKLLYIESTATYEDPSHVD